MSKENPIFISDCPRCGVKEITFTVLAAFTKRDWYQTVFCRCRNCAQGSTFEIEMKNSHTDIMNESAGIPVNLFCDRFNVQEPKFNNVAKCPEFVPEQIKQIFDEAAMCRALACHSASGAMYRKVLDQATRTLVDVKPGEQAADGAGIAWKQFKDLRLRLDWLIAQGKLPLGVDQLVDCVREDGNDAAHALETIGGEGAADLEEFSTTILEHLFTTPGKISRNKERRDDRRSENAG